MNPVSAKKSSEIEARMRSLNAKFQLKMESFLGYPCNGNFNFESLYSFLSFPINNIGDPYLSSTLSINTHEIEREILAAFMNLTSADEKETWGYCTNGGTEGNMYGIYLGRELFPKSRVYYSEESHYSIDKITRVLNVECEKVETLDNGQIKLDHLDYLLRKNCEESPILFLNIGTTMKGAIDDLRGVKQLLKNLNIKESYIHADAALSGMVLPFLDTKFEWDFSHGIDSISISGHKMLGAPMPCGIVLAKKENVNLVAQDVEYIGTQDTTLPGSRNGVSPLFLWHRFFTLGFNGQKEIVNSCLDLSEYTVREFNKRGIDAWKNPDSFTVVIPRPCEKVVKKWQLAVQGDLAHIITMPHVTKAQIDLCIEEILKANDELMSGAIDETYFQLMSKKI